MNSVFVISFTVISVRFIDHRPFASRANHVVGRTRLDQPRVPEPVMADSIQVI